MEVDVVTTHYSDAHRPVLHRGLRPLPRRAHHRQGRGRGPQPQGDQPDEGRAHDPRVHQDEPPAHGAHARRQRPLPVGEPRHPDVPGRQVRQGLLPVPQGAREARPGEPAPVLRHGHRVPAFRRLRLPPDVRRRPQGRGEAEEARGGPRLPQHLPGGQQVRRRRQHHHRRPLPALLRLHHRGHRGRRPDQVPQRVEMAGGLQVQGRLLPGGERRRCGALRPVVQERRQQVDHNTKKKTYF